MGAIFCKTSPCDSSVATKAASSALPLGLHRPQIHSKAAARHLARAVACFSAASAGRPTFCAVSGVFPRPQVDLQRRDLPAASRSRGPNCGLSRALKFLLMLAQFAFEAPSLRWCLLLVGLQAIQARDSKNGTSPWLFFASPVLPASVAVAMFR